MAYDLDSGSALTDAISGVTGVSDGGTGTNMSATGPGVVQQATAGAALTSSLTPTMTAIVNTGTLTLPTSTDTLVGRDTLDVLTRKTLTTPTISGTGFANANHAHAGSTSGGQIAGASALSEGTTGTGAFARAIAPTFTAPAASAAKAQVSGTTYEEAIELELIGNAGADRGIGLGFNVPSGGTAVQGGIISCREVAAADDDTYLKFETRLSDVLTEVFRVSRHPRFPLSDKVLTVQVDVTSSTTLVNLTELAITVSGAMKYRFWADIFTSSNASGGVKFAIGGTATATSITYEALTYSGGTATQTRSTSLGGAVGGVTAVTAATVRIFGTIVVNAQGTLVPMFAQNASFGTASSALINSTFSVRGLA